MRIREHFELHVLGGGFSLGSTEGQAIEVTIGARVPVFGPDGVPTNDWRHLTLDELMGDDNLRRAVDDAVFNLNRVLSVAIADKNPGHARLAALRKERLLGIFDDQRIFAEEIPNEYWQSGTYMAKYSPWFRVTTRVGHFKIGWRKRVIALDWSGTTVAADAKSLFPDEDVTKIDRSIHAHSYEDAKRYLTTVLLAAAHSSDSSSAAGDGGSSE